MRKRLISLVLIISLIFGMTSISLAVPGPSPSVVLNDVAISLEQDIYTNDAGQLMVPLRQIAEVLNYKILWDGADNSIKLTNDSNTIKLQIGKSYVNLNGVEISLSTNPVIKGKNTFVPVEIFSNAFELVIGWDNAQEKLKMSKIKDSSEAYFQMPEEKTISLELENYMKALLEKENFHGSVLVAKGGKLLLNNGYGFADFGQHTLNKSQTKYAIGSVTKQFTAMAVMQLVEKGLINVEDKVSKYLPKLQHGDLITIENLLTHTSGLANFTELSEFYLMDSDAVVPMDIVNLIKEMPLEYTPGDGFKYSNTNYLLLGMIVEKITNISLEEYLQKNIFTPLNMVNTGTAYGVKNHIHDATAYAGYLDVVPVDDSVLLRKAYGAGNLYSTVEDLYRWDRALNTEQLVKKETLDKVFKGYVEISDTASYGFGWMIQNTDKGKEIFHGGNTLGFTSNIARYIDKDLTIIVLTNNGYYDVDSITEDLSSIVLQKDYKMPTGLVEIEIKDYDLYNKYEGRYHFLEGSYIEILRVDNKLYAQATGQGAFEIYPRAIDDFFAKIIDASIRFVTEDDEVTMLVFKQLGMEIECFRVEAEAKGENNYSE